MTVFRQKGQGKRSQADHSLGYCKATEERDRPLDPEAGCLHAEANRQQLQPRQAVYEPFCGSGTTIIAAEMTGRICLAFELSPAYVDVAVKRWKQFTGEMAVLEGTEQSRAEAGGGG